MQKLTDAVEETSHITKVNSHAPVQTNPTEKQKQVTPAAGADRGQAEKYSVKD